MHEYMLGMTKVVIRLKHRSPIHNQIAISMQLANDDDHIMYVYACDYGGQHLPALLADELLDNCQELAQNLLKGRKNGYDFHRNE
jgi:hypothetical protein